MELKQKKAIRDGVAPSYKLLTVLTLLILSMGWYWLIYNGTGSVEGGTGWYLALLSRYGQYWLVLGGTGQYGAEMVDT